MNTTCLVHIVDDDAAVRDACAFLMEALGHAHQTWEHGQAFLDQVDCHRPTVALIDLRMPFASGAEVVSQLQQRHSTIAPLDINRPRRCAHRSGHAQARRGRFPAKTHTSRAFTGRHTTSMATRTQAATPAHMARVRAQPYPQRATHRAIDGARHDQQRHGRSLACVTAHSGSAPRQCHGQVSMRTFGTIGAHLLAIASTIVCYKHKKAACKVYRPLFIQINLSSGAG